MSYIKNIMQEEHQRLQALRKKYIGEIDSLPKGTVSIKKRNKSEYLSNSAKNNQFIVNYADKQG